MVFYQGKGYLIYVIPIALFVLSAKLFDKDIWWTAGVISTVVALLVFAYFSHAEHKGNPYKYRDKLTGEEIEVEHINSVYWIKAEYCALALAGILLFSLLF